MDGRRIISHQTGSNKRIHQHKSFYLSESLKSIPKKNYLSSDEEKEDEWCCFILSEIDETSLYVMRRHYDLKEIYGESKTVTNACRDFLRSLKNIWKIKIT